jgi:hypothetical protein
VAKYRVHFTWKEKEYQLIARSLDLTHPYFVSIKDLLFPKGKNLIIDPSEDDVRKTFSETNHVMIPLQSVSMIEELADDGTSKVMPFGVVDEEEQNNKKS